MNALRVVFRDAAPEPKTVGAFVQEQVFGDAVPDLGFADRRDLAGADRADAGAGGDRPVHDRLSKHREDVPRPVQAALGQHARSHGRVDALAADVEKGLGEAVLKRVHHRAGEHLFFSNGEVLVAGIFQLRPRREGAVEGLCRVGLVEQVPREQRVPLRDVPVETTDRKVFGSGRRRVDEDLRGAIPLVLRIAEVGSLVPRQLSYRGHVSGLVRTERVEIQVRLHPQEVRLIRGAHAAVLVSCNRPDGTTAGGNAVGRQRNDALARQRVGNDPDLALRFVLPDVFDVPEEEHLVAPERPAKRAAILMLPEWLLLGGRPLHLVKPGVAVELVQRAMKGVRARPGHRVQHRAIAPVLCPVCVGQHLEFTDRIHAQAGAQDARARSAILVGLNAGAIHQNLLPVGARAGDGPIFLLAGERVPDGAGSPRDVDAR